MMYLPDGNKNENFCRYIFVFCLNIRKTSLVNFRLKRFFVFFVDMFTVEVELGEVSVTSQATEKIIPNMNGYLNKVICIFFYSSRLDNRARIMFVTDKI